MILSIAGRFFGQSEECTGDIVPGNEEVLNGKVVVMQALEGVGNSYQKEEEDMEGCI